MNTSEAVALMMEGKRVSRTAWINDEKPTFIVITPGSVVIASFNPMVDHLGEGAVFTSRDHIDAIFKYPNGQIECDVGYPLAHDDIFASDWFEVK
jgi:hypothetical protein